MKDPYVEGLKAGAVQALMADDLYAKGWEDGYRQALYHLSRVATHNQHLRLQPALAQLRRHLHTRAGRA